MSYLNALRLHFAGQFQANISTVNNDPAHFDNANFQSSYQEMQGPGMDPPNGWFNPQGDAAFRLLGCKVTAAWMPSGQVSRPDMVLSYVITDSDAQPPAKLVDLDSEQQLVSEIWGLQVRIADEQGNTLMRGDFEPAAFTDIWGRATGGGSDNNAGAMYQSVLTNLWWGDLTASPFLTALQQAASDGLLSIKFNVDGLNMDFTAPDFMCGRITGTIGPATADEPHHMVMGRQFMASCPTSQGFPFPEGQINFFAGVVDSEASCIYLDLGNAVPTASTRGPMVNLGDLTLNVNNPSAPSVNPLGTIPAAEYTMDPDWYAETAGVVALPLSAAQLNAVASAQLVLTGNQGVIISEWSSGAFVRADCFVYRISPDEPCEIPVYAMQWGQPLAGAVISFEADPSQLQPSSNLPNIPAPPVAVPPDALGLEPNATATTDQNGLATITFTPGDPGTPRYFNNGTDYGIDGQVYGIRPSFQDSQQYNGPVNQWNFISILLWSGFKPSDPVTWADLQPIFQQYANLYPVMNRFLDLSNYDDVKRNTYLLQLAFGLAAENPNVMPVTRDLSPAKRNAIQAWLKNPLPAPAGWHPVTAMPKAMLAEPTAAAASFTALRGGKAAALANRLILQNK
jgi:hypothetical protein